MSNVFEEYNKMFSQQRQMIGAMDALKNNTRNEIEDFRERLKSGIVEFEYYKQDKTTGEMILRPARGTTCQNVLSTKTRQEFDPKYDETLERYKNMGDSIIWYWDMDKEALRCFSTKRFGKIIKYIPVSRYHSTQVPLDETSIDLREAQWINNEIPEKKERLIQLLYLSKNSMETNFIISPGSNSEPILTIEITAKDSMKPYTFNINDVKEEIEDTWKIKLKRIFIKWIIEY